MNGAMSLTHEAHLLHWVLQREETDSLQLLDCQLYLALERGLSYSMSVLLVNRMGGNMLGPVGDVWKTHPIVTHITDMLVVLEECGASHDDEVSVLSKYSTMAELRSEE